ncbi:MAG TPA: DUF948 domain-containing protein [bacterium]|nr:DUF948 domain-containing protein [bacterium]
MAGISMAEVSLAVIALAFAVAVAALVPALLQLRRTARQGEAVLESVHAALPELLAELEDLVRKLNRATDTVASLAASVERLERLSSSTVRIVDGALEKVGHMVMPSLANIAGLVSVLREGMEWARPRRDRRRDGE